MSKNLDVHYSSKSNEWSTPQWLYDYLNEKYKFTLDPASDGENQKCSKFYTQLDNGLEQDWYNDSVFCNPPYGRELSKWVKKAFEESLLGDNPIVLLIPARPDTSYWHDYIFNKADTILFIRGRLKFGDSNNSAPFPSAIIIYNDVNKTNNKDIAAIDLRTIVNDK